MTPGSLLHLSWVHERTLKRQRLQLNRLGYRSDEECSSNYGSVLQLVTKGAVRIREGKRHLLLPVHSLPQLCSHLLPLLGTLACQSGLLFQLQTSGGRETCSLHAAVAAFRAGQGDCSKGTEFSSVSAVSWQEQMAMVVHV